MKELRDRAFYKLTSPAQWSLYAIAEDARMWNKTLAILAGVGMAMFVLMCFFYAADKESHKAELDKANQRVLTMVEQLGQKGQNDH